VIAGVGHVRRHSDADAPRSLTDELETTHPGATWAMLPIDASSVRAIQATIGVSEPPSVAVAITLADPRLADLPANAFLDRASVTCVHPPCEEPDAPIERIGQIADALLVP
jgi:hypothetical protein